MQQQFAMLLRCGSPLGPDVAVSAATAREGFWAYLTTLVLQTDCPGPITLTGTSPNGCACVARSHRVVQSAGVLVGCILDILTRASITASTSNLIGAAGLAFPVRTRCAA